MSGEIAFVFVIVGIILLIIGYILLDKAEKPKNPDKRCMNCHTKQYEDMMDIRCKNKKSEFYGTMVDDYSCCGRWKR